MKITKNHFIPAIASFALAAPLIAAEGVQEPVAARAAAGMDAEFLKAALKCFRSYRFDGTILREMLKSGADINATDTEGNNALMKIIKASDGHSESRICPELFELLRDAGINLHARNKSGMNAAELNCCLDYPYLFLTEEFDKAGVPVCAEARLAAAAATSNVAEVERLLQQKADPAYNSACALRKCMGVMTSGPKENEVIIAALLLQAGLDPNLGGERVMGRAVHSDFAEQLVPLLLQHGFRVRDYAAWHTNGWLEHLLEHRSPARVKTADLLICHGAELDDKDWYTPCLCHLVEQGNGHYGDMMLAQHMVELGLDATRPNSDGKTAAMIAREKKMGLGIRGILERPAALLAERQQKARSADAAGRTPLMLAVADPHVEAIEVYKWLRFGAVVNARDAQGRTALHYINSFCPQKDLKAKLLIEAGADVNARDSEGLTPLLALPSVHDFPIPQQRSCAPIIRMLQQAGADMQATDKHGHNKLELYLLRDDLSSADEECCELLRQYGCTVRPER